MVGVWASFAPWLQALIVGLVGAVTGGVIAGLYSKAGSIEGARIAKAQAQELFEQERDLRRVDRARQIQQAFLEELRLNAEIVGTRLGGPYATLLTDAWAVARGDIWLLGAGRKLHAVYARIHRYNDGVSGWDRNSETDDPIRKEAKDLKAMMQDTIKVLEADIAPVPVP
jgi:predicted Rdx family selenoprotein